MYALLLACLPGRLQKLIRRLRGQAIHRHARISFGAVISVHELEIGPGAHIRPFVRIRAERLRVGTGANIGPLSLIAAHTVEIGSDSSISPMVIISSDASQERATFSMGKHSKIFPLCWLEPGHGITLGDRVGIGGHGLIFTHGSWANYFLGAPVTFGSVRIEDRVWLPWRVFVMPGVTIGARAIIGAGSVVTRSVPSDALAAGSPAKVVRATSYAQLTAEDLRSRAAEAVNTFLSENSDVSPADLIIVENAAELSHTPVASVALALDPDTRTIDWARKHDISLIDPVGERLWGNSKVELAHRVAAWLSRYGVRFDNVTAHEYENTDHD